MPQTPFWANNHSDMYVRVLQDELQFPEDRAMDQDTKSLIRGVSETSLVDDIRSLYAFHVAASTKPCIKDVRTTDQTAPIFLYDVSRRRHM